MNVTKERVKVETAKITQKRKKSDNEAAIRLAMMTMMMELMTGDERKGSWEEDGDVGDAAALTPPPRPSGTPHTPPPAAAPA